LAEAGGQVMNQVISRKSLDAVRFAEVRTAFSRGFPFLATQTPSKHRGGS
jgi:hypothetical protein